LHPGFGAGQADCRQHITRWHITRPPHLHLASRGLEFSKKTWRMLCCSRPASLLPLSLCRDAGATPR
jgi:hypothetical protein